MFDLNDSFGDIEEDEFDVFSNVDKIESIQDENDLAILHYAKSLKLNPNSADTYFSIANFYYMKGEFKLALQNYIKAIEIDETNMGVYNYKGSAFTDMEQHKKPSRNQNLPT